MQPTQKKITGRTALVALSVGSYVLHSAVDVEGSHRLVLDLVVPSFSGGRVLLVMPPLVLDPICGQTFFCSFFAGSLGGRFLNNIRLASVIH